jgi:hypothetical protein
LSIFTSTLRAAINLGQNNFLALDRGRARQRNNNSVDSRATYFTTWLTAHRVGAELLQALDSPQLEALIGAYVDHLHESGGIQHMPELAVGTIVGYLSAAAYTLRHHFGLRQLCLMSGSLTKTGYVAELLAQQRAWKKPKDQKEPLSSEILTVMNRLSEQASSGSPTGFTTQIPCIWDCCRLGIFTGSRLGEYGQSHVTKADGTDGFDPVPVSIHVPKEWRGAPLAFIRGDFVFLDAGSRCIDDYVAVQSPLLITQVRIRFRYDKSPNNFVFRTYNRTGQFLCAVEATLSLTRRAMAIHRDFARGREPLAMFIDATGRRWSVRGRHLQTFMKRSCIIAHPDPAHHLRRHIKCLTSHCLRVTAAVALFNSGEKEEMIAFRLRWNSDAVRIYLRDCYKSIGTLTSRALQGAFSDNPPLPVAATEAV